MAERHSTTRTDKRPGKTLWFVHFIRNPFLTSGLIDRIVQNHRAILRFPLANRWSRPTTHCRWLPPPSPFAIDLMQLLLQDRELRLCSPVYHLYDFRPSHRLHSPGRFLGEHAEDRFRRHVFANGAEDIKAHPFFHGLQWNNMHMITPPFVPTIREDQDITKYFEDADLHVVPSTSSPTSNTSSPTSKPASKASKLTTDKQSNLARAKADICLGDLTDKEFPTIKEGANTKDWIESKGKHEVKMKQQGQKSMPLCSDDVGSSNISERASEKAKAKDKSTQPVPKSKQRRAKVQPRDRILRDVRFGREALELRKEGAFLGYTYRRIRPLGLEALDDLVMEKQKKQKLRPTILSTGEHGF